jgi:MFS family permease
MTTATSAGPSPASVDIESRYAWTRLWAALALGTVGSVGMWSFVVALPSVQADFGVTRAEASLPFTLTMFGFAIGGVLMGRLADRFHILVPVCCGALLLALGYGLTSIAGNLWQFALAQGLIGLGSSATFGPLMTDISRWFGRRRGIAIAIASSGNYLAGVVWPPLVQHLIEAYGWRSMQMGIGAFCLVAMLPFMPLMRRRAPQSAASANATAAGSLSTLGLTANQLTALLFIAGIGCCVAMSMPQVHLVAYCADLGYGPARGAEMLSAMLGFGIFSRLGAGLIADRIGGLRALLVSSVLQGFALFLYLWFDGLASLYVISALFGLFQGGIVPMYAVIVRDFFSPKEAGTRLGIILMATLGGMALGGWMSGLIFDLSGSYRAAFLNGLGWNLVNVSIVGWLTLRPGRRMAHA